MKIILAPNAFKESLTAHEAASAMVRGFRRALPGAELIELPVADGGDGTAEVLRRAIGGEVRFVSVTGPLGGRIKAPIIRLKRQVVPTDVIEMAKCSGLALIPREKRNPMLTTTYGLGEMIAASLKRGARRIIITLGGSATVDGGAGMAQALGFSLLDRKGRSIPRGGRGLELIGRIEPPSDVHRFSGVEIIAVCDVKNKLLGSNGAAAVFGPQKGATPEMIAVLEAGLRNLAFHLQNYMRSAPATRLKTKRPTLTQLPGGGAAGGLGAGLAGFLDAEIRPGAEFILDLIRFREVARGADLIVTGEGKLDRQTLGGKAPAAVGRAATDLGVPVIAIAGSVDSALTSSPRLLRKGGWSACFSILPRPIPLEESISRAGELLDSLCAQLGSVMRSVRGKS